MCVCVGVCTWVQVPTEPRGIGCPRTWVTGGSGTSLALLLQALLQLCALDSPLALYLSLTLTQAGLELTVLLNCLSAGIRSVCLHAQLNSHLNCRKIMLPRTTFSISSLTSVHRCLLVCHSGLSLKGTWLPPHPVLYLHTESPTTVAICVAFFADCLYTSFFAIFLPGKKALDSSLCLSEP